MDPNPIASDDQNPKRVAMDLGEEALESVEVFVSGQSRSDIATAIATFKGQLGIFRTFLDQQIIAFALKEKSLRALRPNIESLDIDIAEVAKKVSWKDAYIKSHNRELERIAQNIVGLEREANASKVDSVSVQQTLQKLTSTLHPPLEVLISANNEHKKDDARFALGILVRVMQTLQQNAATAGSDEDLRAAVARVRGIVDYPTEESVGQVAELIHDLLQKTDVMIKSSNKLQQVMLWAKPELKRISDRY